MFFYKKFLHAQKAPKAQKTQKTQKTKRRPCKRTKMQNASYVLLVCVCEIFF